METSQEAYVKNIFANSQYIKNRDYIKEEIKYFPEEIQFWVDQINNCNWDISDKNNNIFLNEFEQVYSVNHNRSLSKPQPNDYVGQTFLIEKSIYPYGMFLSSISIFLKQTSEASNITLDVRPLINGMPGTEFDVLPMSKVVVSGNTLTNATYKWFATKSAADQPSKLDFKFDFPIYLSPGYYCFTLKTNSSENSVFIAENGVANIDSGAIVTNPYLGDYIYSGQGESWVIDPTKDLCFVLNKAEFDLGTKNLYLDIHETNQLGFDYDIVNLVAGTKEVSKVSYISDVSVDVKDFYTENITTLPITLNSNAIVPSHSKLKATESLRFTVSLTNTDKNLTPILDLHQTGVALTKNYIDPYSEEISISELSATEGSAQAKYTTRAVVLNDEFDADGISVYVDVNRPSGTSIEVFYRILNRYDFSLEFKDSPWYLLPKKSGATPALLSSDYVEEAYEQLNILYTGANKTEYNSFNQLAIKVVFYSDDPSKVPSIKNLRVIATL